METLSLSTRDRCDLLDVTRAVAEALGRNRGKDWTNGLVCVYSPHTTCGVTINEGYDPDVRRDLINFLSSLVPVDWDFRHAEGNSDAHVKAAMVGSSCLVPVKDGRLALGRWQAVYLCEFDGPRTRELRLSFIRAE